MTSFFHLLYLVVKLYRLFDFLSRPQSCYGALLAAIDAKLAQQRYALLPEQLAAVVEPAKSAVFDEIIY